jgi:hypothetical protein
MNKNLPTINENKDLTVSLNKTKSLMNITNKILAKSNKTVAPTSVGKQEIVKPTEVSVTNDLVWQDPDTGLIWQKKVDDKEYTWEESFDYAKKLNKQSYGNINTWRVPTIKELRTLLTKEKNINGKGNSFYIKKELVENIPTEYFWVWSSTEHKDFTSLAWWFYFYDGDDYSSDKSVDYYVLCVADSNL